MNRDQVTARLQELGFDRLQQTILVHPDDGRMDELYWSPAVTVQLLHRVKGDIKVGEFLTLSREDLVRAIQAQRAGWHVACDAVGVPTEVDDVTVAPPASDEPPVTRRLWES